MAMLHDVARCSACRACMVACKQWHDLPADFSTPFEGQYQSHADLTSKTYNLIKMNERVDAKGKLHWDFIRLRLHHLRLHIIDIITIQPTILNLINLQQRNLQNNKKSR